MLTITEDCINCNACIDECPNNAIFAAGDSYTIDGVTYPPLSNDLTFIVNDLCKMCEAIPTRRPAWPSVRPTALC